MLVGINPASATDAFFWSWNTANRLGFSHELWKKVCPNKSRTRSSIEVIEDVCIQHTTKVLVTNVCCIEGKPVPDLTKENTAHLQVLFDYVKPVAVLVHGDAAVDQFMKGHRLGPAWIQSAPHLSRRGLSNERRRQVAEELAVDLLRKAGMEVDGSEGGANK
jgi:hypothetical protein